MTAVLSQHDSTDKDSQVGESKSSLLIVREFTIALKMIRFPLGAVTLQSNKDQGPWERGAD